MFYRISDSILVYHLYKGFYKITSPKFKMTNKFQYSRYKTECFGLQHGAFFQALELVIYLLFGYNNFVLLQRPLQTRFSENKTSFLFIDKYSYFRFCHQLLIDIHATLNNRKIHHVIDMFCFCIDQITHFRIGIHF